MKLAELQQAGRAPQLPLAVELAGEVLQLHSLLRVLPGRRYVGRATWQGRNVLAKLLVGPKAARQFQRERQGAAWLSAQGLSSPALVAEGQQDAGAWLLFDYLDAAQSLGELWQLEQSGAFEQQQNLLAEALVVIAQLHSKGLWQEDLHLDNLLRQAGRWYLIDAAGIRCEIPGEPLSRKRVLENLGVFFAQLPRSLDAYLEELLVHYLLVNGEHALPLEALQKEIAQVRRWRLADWLKKLARDCTAFSARKGAFGLEITRREEVDFLQPLLAAPDALTAQGHVYKTGGAATVVRIELQGRPLVVKRYNIKNFAHWLKRFWRPSRAWTSWREGNCLDFFGIATARPLAVIERRWLWLRGPAFLITDYLAGEDIIARFKPYLDQVDGQCAPAETELQALDRLFAALLAERISHGDLKGHNLFWQAQTAEWALIDLDAMQRHSQDAAFARAFARDRMRFLRNWPQDSALYKLLDRRLPQVPGACSDERG